MGKQITKELLNSLNPKEFSIETREILSLKKIKKIKVIIFKHKKNKETILNFFFNESEPLHIFQMIYDDQSTSIFLTDSIDNEQIINTTFKNFFVEFKNDPIMKNLRIKYILSFGGTK